MEVPNHEPKILKIIKIGFVIYISLIICTMECYFIFFNLIKECKNLILMCCFLKKFKHEFYDFKFLKAFLFVYLRKYMFIFYFLIWKFVFNFLQIEYFFIIIFTTYLKYEKLWVYHVVSLWTCRLFSLEEVKKMSHQTISVKM